MGLTTCRRHAGAATREGPERLQGQDRGRRLQEMRLLDSWCPLLLGHLELKVFPTRCAGCRCRTCRELANARCPVASSVVVGKSEHRIFHFPYFMSLASK